MLIHAKHPLWARLSWLLCEKSVSSPPFYEMAIPHFLEQETEALGNHLFSMSEAGKWQSSDLTRIPLEHHSLHLSAIIWASEFLLRSARCPGGTPSLPALLTQECSPPPEDIYTGYL